MKIVRFSNLVRVFYLYPVLYCIILAPSRQVGCHINELIWFYIINNNPFSVFASMNYLYMDYNLCLYGKICRIVYKNTLSACEQYLLHFVSSVYTLFSCCFVCIRWVSIKYVSVVHSVGHIVCVFLYLSHWDLHAFTNPHTDVRV